MKISGVFWKVIPRATRTWLTRRLHPTFTVSAAGIVTNERGEVLLLEHVLRPGSGWGIPGGLLETGEQPNECLRREIREETGIDLDNIRLYRCWTRRRHIEIIMTAKGVGQPRVMSREITEVGWFAVDEMPEEMSRDQKNLIKAALGRDQERCGRE